MSFRFAKIATAAATIVLLSLAVTGCAGESPASSGESPAGGSQQKEAPQAGDGDYAFGTDRDDMATAVEKAFSTDNATARWEGDRLVLSLDGDIDTIKPGFTQCRVLSHLLLETDKASIKFPNGSVTCEEALAE